MSNLFKPIDALQQQYASNYPTVFYLLVVIVLLAIILFIANLFNKPAPKIKSLSSKKQLIQSDNQTFQGVFPFPIQQFNKDLLKPVNDPIFQKDVRYCYVGDDELNQQLNPQIYRINSDTKVKCAHFEDASEGSFEDDVNFLWRQNTNTFYKPKNLNLPAVMRNGVMSQDQLPFTEKDTFLQKLASRGDDEMVYNQIIRGNQPLPKKVSKEVLLV
jgi:hypothetical protein